MLAAEPSAVRRRMLRRWLQHRGVHGCTDAQLREAERLARPGADRRGVALPGGLDLLRRDGRLDLAPRPRPEEDPRRVRR